MEGAGMTASVFFDLTGVMGSTGEDVNISWYFLKVAVVGAWEMRAQQAR